MAESDFRSDSGSAAWEIPVHSVHELHPRRTAYCVCIPVINEGRKIQEQLRRMKPLAAEADIIIADGGSSDGSLAPELVLEAGVRALLVKQDGGRLSAQLRMGYAYALRQGYEGIITIDGNGKDNVEAIPDFIRCLEQGYDFVQGSRYVPGGQALNTPWIRALAVRMIHVPVVSWLAGFRFTDTTNGYRGYSRRLLLDPRIQPFRRIFAGYELLAYLSVRGPRLHFKIKEIPVIRKYPPEGRIPTKLGWRGMFHLLAVLWRLGWNCYDPKS